MNLNCISLIIFFALTKESSQNCVIINGYQQYLSGFSRYPPFRNYIHCENEILSSDFHTKIPKLTSIQQMQSLEINNTNSPEIASEAFETLQSISEIRINAAGVHVIQAGAFSNLKNLRQLSLKNNRIVEVKDHFFANLTSLFGLDLSYNNIASITENSFADLKSLQRLILQNNFLSDLAPNIFKGLSKVEVLDLSFNKLTRIDKKLFTNIANLDTLSLNNNNLYDFDGSTLIKNLRMKRFNINNNFLKSLSNLTFSGSLTKLNFSGNLIQSLKFTNHTIVQVIDLSGCGITSIKDFSFKNVQINELYLDQNYLGLTAISNESFNSISLQVISLKDNQIKKLDPNTFKNNKNLVTLNLAKNYLSSKDVANLPASLQNLDISLNNINSDLNLTQLLNLKTLNISSNNLTEIGFNFLKGFKWLYRLNLSNNKISKINLGGFRDLKQLRDLDLSNNDISSLEIGVFVGLDTLFRLDLSRNQLSTINEGVFHNLRYLQVLNLGYNSINFASVDNALSHLPLLKDIGLAGNGWSCNRLSNVIKDYKKIKIIDVANYDVTNVDGVACNYEETESAHQMFDLETKSFTTFASKLYTSNVLLVFILIGVIFIIILKYVPGNVRLKNKLWREKSEQELQLVNDC